MLSATSRLCELHLGGLFLTSKHLICRVQTEAGFAGEIRDGLALRFDPFLCLCSGTGGVHHSKPFNAAKISTHSSGAGGDCIQMNGVDNRLRKERERLGMSQAVLGELGGVKANAHGNYEKGYRFPDAAYLAAVAGHGVDVLYVVIGERSRMAADSITADEPTLLTHYRQLPESDRSHTSKMASRAGRNGQKNNLLS